MKVSRIRLADYRGLSGLVGILKRRDAHETTLGRHQEKFCEIIENYSPSEI